MNKPLQVKGPEERTFLLTREDLEFLRKSVVEAVYDVIEDLTKVRWHEATAINMDAFLEFFLPQYFPDPTSPVPASSPPT